MTRPQATEGQRQGICCRTCGCRDLRVVYTRQRPDGKIRRRRECRHCGRRVTTYETAAT